MSSGSDISGATILGIVSTALQEEFFSPQSHEELDKLARELGGHMAWVEDTDSLNRVLSDRDSDPTVKVLVTSWAAPRLTQSYLDHLPGLKLVAHTGATVRPLVSEEFFERGVAITQAGEAMARPVAEVALTFTLNLLHQVHYFDFTMRHGMDFHSSATTARLQHEIAGAAIGVVGASRTGRHYIKLVQSLGAQVGVYDPFLSAAEANSLGVTKVALPDLVAHSQIVAVHAPSLPETQHMIDAAMLARMADGAGLVNTARSWLVDEAALLAEVSTGRIDAALDVFDEEPLPQDHPLRQLPNVLLTPHRAAGTAEGRRRGGAIVLDEIARFLSRQPLRHEITADDLKRMA